MAPATVALAADARSCPDANAIARAFDAAPDEKLDAHLDGCSECRFLVSHLARGRAMPAVAVDAARGDELEREATYVDRYLLLERVGAGGMGEVYRALDPELDREIAIKILHAGQTAETLLREAQAVARVVHENVISVFDVGTQGDDVFIAMELVDGTTLAGWLRESARSDREIVDVFVRAGRGLAAAHAVGLVHRDFKPENVLVGRDGIVRVTDFGLASRPGEYADRAGTAAYMAPEQRAGGVIDARVDQFAFCIALQRALHAPSPWIRKVLARGSSEHPVDRFPAMHDVLAALDHDPHRRWRRTAMVVAALAVIAGAGAAIDRSFATSGDELCRGADAQITSTWNPARASEIHAAFTASGSPYAETAWTVFARDVERYRDAWIAMRTEACVATRKRGEQSEQRLDERMACLDDRRAELAGLVRAFSSPDAAAIEAASDAVGRLGRIDACGRASTRHMSEKLLSPAGVAVRAQLAEATALDAASRYAAALPIVRAGGSTARSLGDKQLLAEATLLEGELLTHSGDARGAEVVLYEAMAVADTAGDDELRARTQIQLVRVLGRDQAKLAQAKTFAGLARATAERLGSRPQLLSDLAFALVPVLTQAGDLDAAERSAREALALEEQVGDPDNVDVATAIAYLANVRLTQGHYPEAGALYARDLAIVERVLGADHPRTAATLDNLGIAALYAGDYTESLAYHRRAIAIRERVLGAAHPDLAVSLGNAAGALLALEQPAEAARMFARAIKIFEAARGLDHPTLATFHSSLALAYTNLRRFDDARAEYELALAIQQRVLGPAHPDVGQTITFEGELEFLEHHYREALASYQRGLAILEAARGPDHPDVATALVGLGKTMLALGERAAAVPILERALAIQTASAVAPDVLKEVTTALAHARGARSAP